MEDNEIIELFNRRSQNAIKAAAEKFGGICQRIALNILKNNQDAEECVNDTYMKLWDTIPPACPKALSAYAAKIARNTAISKYRKNHSEKRGSGNADLILDELEGLIVSPQSVEGQVERAELLAAINAFLSEQPKDKRIIFVRRYWYCESAAEIAEGTGLSRTNITTILSRQRTALKKYLEERGL